MDCTGSMASYIAQAKQSSLTTIRSLREAHAGIAFSAAFVGYMDFDTALEQYACKDFTEDISELEQFLSGVRATGGGDAAEDVAGGFDMALNRLSWTDRTAAGAGIAASAGAGAAVPVPSTEAAAGAAATAPPTCVKIILHVADAPPHGNAFHAVTLSDHYPKGDKHGRDPRRQLAEMAQRGIDYYFLKINSSTDKMLEVFSAAYETAKASEEQTFMVMDMAPGQPSRVGVEAPERARRPLTLSMKEKRMEGEEAEAEVECSFAVDEEEAHPSCGASLEGSDVSGPKGVFAAMKRMIAPSMPAPAPRSRIAPSAAVHGPATAYGGEDGAYSVALAHSVLNSVKKRSAAPSKK